MATGSTSKIATQFYLQLLAVTFSTHYHIFGPSKHCTLAYSAGTDIFFLEGLAKVPTQKILALWQFAMDGQAKYQYCGY